MVSRSSLALDPNVISCRQSTARVAGIHNAPRFDDENMAFSCGSCDVLAPFRKNVHLSGTKNDLPDQGRRIAERNCSDQWRIRTSPMRDGVADDRKNCWTWYDEHNRGRYDKGKPQLEGHELHSIGGLRGLVI